MRSVRLSSAAMSSTKMLAFWQESSPTTFPRAAKNGWVVFVTLKEEDLTCFWTGVPESDQAKRG